MNEKATRELQSYTINKSFFIYAVKKTERIARAIYLITNFFPESEPLRMRLREESLSLLDHFASVTESSIKSVSLDLSFIKRSLEMSLASLGIAHAAGLISEMNFSILRSEYEKLLRSLIHELEQDGSYSPVSFPGDFFGIEREEADASSERYLFTGGFDLSERISGELQEEKNLRRKAVREIQKNTPTLSKRHEPFIKDKKTEIKDKETPKDTERERTPQPIKRTSLKTSPQESGTIKPDRKEIIIQLIKDRKEITVKDVAKEIADVSEKTLQREINALVDSGVLERVGARRWSRYRFA